MSKETLTQWYIAGTHAVRSACEQGVESAKDANRIGSSQKIKPQPWQWCLTILH